MIFHKYDSRMVCDGRSAGTVIISTTPNRRYYIESCNFACNFTVYEYFGEQRYCAALRHPIKKIHWYFSTILCCTSARLLPGRSIKSSSILNFTVALFVALFLGVGRAWGYIIHICFKFGHWRTT